MIEGQITTVHDPDSLDMLSMLRSGPATWDELHARFGKARRRISATIERLERLGYTFDRVEMSQVWLCTGPDVRKMCLDCGRPLRHTSPNYYCSGCYERRIVDDKPLWPWEQTEGHHESGCERTSVGS